MKKIIAISLIYLLYSTISIQPIYSQPSIDSARIVSMNGTISEILVGLGLIKNIVGVDATSTYPKTLLKEKTKVGHRQNLSIEGIVSLNPTLVLAIENDLPNSTIKQLTNANIKVLTFKQVYSIKGTKNLISEISKTFNKEKLAQDIINKLDKDLSIALKQANINKKKKNKVLFIYARGLGTLLVAGKNTQVDKIIELAGGLNAVNSFDNFKPLTPESLISANPDIILLFDSGLKSLGGINGISKIQGINQTNAGKNHKFIEMDGQLLTGFGPRLGIAIQQLAQQFK